MPSQETRRLVNALSEEEVLEAAIQELGENPKQMEVSTTHVNVQYCYTFRDRNKDKNKNMDRNTERNKDRHADI